MELPAAARFCMVAVWAASRQLLLPSLAWSKRKLWSRRYVPSKRLEIREPRSLGSTANGVRFAAESCIRGRTIGIVARRLAVLPSRPP
jgi:hypothetical protein